MTKKGNLRVLVVGLGNMGMAHARAYAKMDGFDLAGLCESSSRANLPTKWSSIPLFAEYGEALATLKPDVVSINTWSDTHVEFAIRAFKAGAHVFLEKPIARTLKDARRVVAAKKSRKKLVVGYILRVHPSWIKFIELAKGLGKPLVMRMNLNQQSVGPAWNLHKTMMRSLSPIVDCGVHYVDVMCQMTGAKPVRIHAIGAHLTQEVETYNYGQLQVEFDDGSVGWFEVGWGPMMSEVAFFVKDVVGPKGSVSIIMPEQGKDASEGDTTTTSTDYETHTRTGMIRLHHAKLNRDNSLAKGDEIFRMDDEPGQDALCEREQLVLLNAIRKDLDLTGHMENAVSSLRIAFAADESVRTKKVVTLR